MKEFPELYTKMTIDDFCKKLKEKLTEKQELRDFVILQACMNILTDERPVRRPSPAIYENIMIDYIDLACYGSLWRMACFVDGKYDFWDCRRKMHEVVYQLSATNHDKIRDERQEAKNCPNWS